jgi:hypothetical protein
LPCWRIRTETACSIRIGAFEGDALEGTVERVEVTRIEDNTF